MGACTCQICRISIGLDRAEAEAEAVAEAVAEAHHGHDESRRRTRVPEVFPAPHKFRCEPSWFRGTVDEEPFL